MSACVIIPDENDPKITKITQDLPDLQSNRQLVRLIWPTL